jgi:hypothetical protein
MVARTIFLALALYQVQGSRLGSPKEDKKITGWAWKDGDHQAPPGHLAAPKAAKTFKHAWAGKEGEPRPDVMDDMSGAALPRKVMEPSEDSSDLEPHHVVKDSVTAKYDADNELKITARASTDLEGTLENDMGESMNLAQFMPKCLAHTKSLIADLDANYGDAQLETILRNWCQSAQEFPNARGTRKVIGFKNHQSCTDFADDLKNARFFELKSGGSDKGYKKFCTDFYAHHGGFEVAPPPPPKEEPVRSGTSWAGLSMVAMGLMLCVA